MKNKAKLLTSVLVAPFLCATIANAEPETTADTPTEVVLFKIHDIVPEKDPDGKVLYCNIGATFFNRTKTDLANVAMNLVWEDEVISETIELEERALREKRRANPRATTSRYPTSALNDRTITMSLKLPPIKTNQQVSLKAKVSTERCFLLLNDMEINVSNCGSMDAAMKGSRDCNNLFRYISPKMPEYYQEFKEKSLEEEATEEDSLLDTTKKELEEAYNETLQTIHNITSEKPVDPKDENEDGAE